MIKNQILDKRIVRFIKAHHILTLATSKYNVPYCATCFYAYSEEENLFIITSDRDTRHINEAVNQNKVAGAIALETKIIGKIRGIQFTGIIKELAGEELRKYGKAYIKRFPVAMLMDTTLWSIEPEYIKMTDNRLGFGKKIIWEIFQKNEDC